MPSKPFFPAVRFRLNLLRIEHRRERLERNLSLAAWLAIAILAAGLIWMTAMSFDLEDQKARRETLQLALKQAGREIQALQPQIDRLQNDVGALASHVMPNLIPMRLGQPIPLDTRLLANISFELADSGKGKQLNYRLEARNPDNLVAYLKVDLLFFNGKGAQIGLSGIGTGNAKSASPIVLVQGGTRVVSAPVELTDEKAKADDIRYFKLRLVE